MEKKMKCDYMSPDVTVININPRKSILEGSLNASNESYEEENI